MSGKGIKRYLSSMGAVLLLSVVLSPGVYAGQNFSFTVDAQYARHLTGSIKHENGFGTSAYFEWQPLDILALGLDSGVIGYFGVSSTTASFSSSVDLSLRLMPWGTQNGISPYLIGAFGLNPFTNNNHSWSGNYHAMAGIGTRLFITSQWALDLGAKYDVYSPQAAPLQTLNATLGISYFFGSEPGAVAAGN